MASNVFGIPITDETVRQLPDYINKDKITATDKAHVALQMKNSEKKAENARTYVENLKAQYGNGVSTECLIYNATGGTLSYILAHDYSGHIGASPYPLEIANGQWGAFLHVHASGAARGSVSCVVYRGKNGYGTVCDWMLGWSNPWIGSNNAYTEIRQRRHYEDEDNWNYILDKMVESGTNHRDSWNGCLSNVIIGTETTSVYEGIMTLEGAGLGALALKQLA